MKCSGENVILRGIVHVVSGFPLHFMLYRGNLDCFSNRVAGDFTSFGLFSLLADAAIDALAYTLHCEKSNPNFPDIT